MAPRVYQTIFEGEIYRTKQGYGAKVLEYVDSRNVLIEFQDAHKHRIWVSAGNLRTFRIGNPYHVTASGVGYIGSGPHKSSTGAKLERSYTVWSDMLLRCYDPATQEKCPTYKGCTVAEEWHNFQNFAEWYKDQYQDGAWQLDKDILNKGNRVYSPENCCLVPRDINALTLNRALHRGELPIGVSPNRKRFKARLSMRGKCYTLGTFDTPEEAFAAYKAAKEAHIRDLVENDYRDILPEFIKVALLAYRVEITD